MVCRENFDVPNLIWEIHAWGLYSTILYCVFGFLFLGGGRGGPCSFFIIKMLMPNMSWSCHCLPSPWKSEAFHVSFIIHLSLNQNPILTFLEKEVHINNCSWVLQRKFTVHNQNPYNLLFFTLKCILTNVKNLFQYKCSLTNWIYTKYIDAWIFLGNLG